MGLPLGRQRGSSCARRRRVLFALVVSILLFSFGGAGALAKINRVFIVPLSHLDIGFTATPREVAAHYRGDVDLALRLVNNLPDARWNIETFWQLEQWLSANSSSLALLESAMETGRLGISASYASMHSSLLTGEEMLRMLYPAQAFGRRVGAPLETAVMNDVPGFAWYVPQALRASGIKRLILGTNLQFDGGMSLPPHMRPFYWAGPDGSSVLTWVSPEGYLEGSFHWELHNPDAFRKRLEALERAGYPYDAILIIDGYGDNASVDKILSKLDAIRRLRFNLNEVEITYSTIDEFFHYMEESYGDTFPTLSGDWGRSWEVSRLAGPWQMAEYRAIQHLLPAAESLSTLASVLAEIPYPDDELASAWSLLRLLGEHSAGPSTGWPDLVTAQQVDESNRTVLSYATSARQITSELIDTAFTAIVGSSDSAEGVADQRDIWLYNPLSWPRSAIVAVPVGELAPDKRYRVIDPASGEELPSARVGNDLLFESSLLPPMGMLRYRLDVSDEEPPTLLPQPDGAAVTQVENEWYRVEIDPQSGWIVGWYDKERALELINPASPYRFNQLLSASHHNDFIGGTPTPVRPEVASVEFVDSPLYTGLRLRYAEETPWHESEILLPRSEKRIEIYNVLDRAQMRYVPYAQHSDHYYFAFPLALAPRQLDVRYQGATRFQSLVHDTLRGANANGIISRAAVDLRDDEWGVTVAHREAFAFSVGGIGHSSSLFLPRESTLFAHVVQKADEGHTKDQGITAFDVEPGAPDLLRFSFVLTTSEGEFDPVEATRYALEWVTPALKWVSPTQHAPLQGDSLTVGGPSYLGQSLISVDRPNVIVTALKQAENSQASPNDPYGARELVVRLQEVAGIKGSVRLETPLAVLSAARTNGVEFELVDSESAAVSLDRLEINPYETLTLKLLLAD